MTRSPFVLAGVAALMGAAGVALAAAGVHANGGELAQRGALFLLLHAVAALAIAARAGVWHLGLEGIMILGACATILGIMLTNSFIAAILIACAMCVLASALLWLVIERLQANPIIAGLGLTGLGIGGTVLAVQSIFGSQAACSLLDIGTAALRILSWISTEHAGARGDACPAASGSCC